MTPEELEELAALYALDLLEGDELLAFEQAMENDPGLKQLVADLRETQAVWVESLPQSSPPFHVKEAVFAAIDSEGKPEAKVVPLPRSRTRLWALAAALILAFLGIFALQYNKDKEIPVAVIPAPQIPPASLPKLPLAPTPDAQNPGDVAVIWHADKQQVEILTSSLPKAPEGMDYQLWILDSDNPKPVSVGVFAPDADGKIALLMTPQATVGTKLNFAVSLEPVGGSPQPTGKIVYVGKPG